MKIKITFFVLMAFGLMSLTSRTQEELFKNESKLVSCRQNIPLTYKKKDDIIVAEKAKTLKDKELILLHYNKKAGSVSFKRYYLVSETKGSNVFNYLVSKKDYLEKKEVAIFLKYTDKYDRFYLAECFDKVLSENSELKELLIEED
jgi:GTPase Era involved in 16S rRNA processing